MPGGPGLQGRAEAHAQSWHNVDSALRSAWLTGGVSAEVKGRVAYLGMGVGLAGMRCRGALCTQGSPLRLAQEHRHCSTDCWEPPECGLAW